MNIRPATREDFVSFAGHPPAMLTRAFVAEHNGRVLAVGGVYYSAGVAFAFCEMDDGMRAHRKSIMRGAKVVVEAVLARMTVPVYAICSKREPNAPAFLSRLGFVPEGMTGLGELYKWGRDGSD